MRERFCRFQINFLSLNDKQVSVADFVIKIFEITVLIGPWDLKHFKWRRFKFSQYVLCIKIKLKYLRIFHAILENFKVHNCKRMQIIRNIQSVVLFVKFVKQFSIQVPHSQKYNFY